MKHSNLVLLNDRVYSAYKLRQKRHTFACMHYTLLYFIVEIIIVFWVRFDGKSIKPNMNSDITISCKIIDFVY